MKKILRRSLSVVLTLAMMLSMVTVMAAGEGVTGISSSYPNSTTLRVTWTNPDDVVKNVVEVTNRGITTTLATLTNGENYVDADVSAGGVYDFVITSTFSDESTAVSEYSAFVTYYDAETFNGWTVFMSDATGEYALRTESAEAYTGNNSAYVKIDHEKKTGSFIDLATKSPTLYYGQEYCLSFWFKTKDYDTASGKNRILYYDPSTNDLESLKIDENYPNGEWHNKKIYFMKTDGKNTYTITNKYQKSLPIQFQFDCYGEVWIDDVEIYAVDANKERIDIDDELEKLGSFEAETGVMGLTGARVSSVNGYLEWTNPTSEDFIMNEIYVEIDGGEKECLATLYDGETSYTHTGGFSSTTANLYTVKSHYIDGTTVEKAILLTNWAVDKKTFPGWQLDITEFVDAKSWRGEYNISTMDAHSGDCSARFVTNHLNDGKQLKLFNTFSFEANTEYCLSFWFKTDQQTRIMVSDPVNSNVNETIDIKYANGDYNYGEWTKKEVKFTYESAKSRMLFFLFVDPGEVFLDDIKLYKTSEGEDENLLVNSDGYDRGSFESAVGLSGFGYTQNGMDIDLSWTNPDMADFEKNDLYLEVDGERTLIETFENGETSYTYTADEKGKAYKFVMVSTIGNITKETTLTAYSIRENSTTTLVPGWKIEYRDLNLERYRGKFGVDTEVVHGGKSSLFFMLENKNTSGVYNLLHKQVMLENGKTYCFSGWIKTSGIGEGAVRFMPKIAGNYYDYNIDLENNQIKNTATGEYEAFDVNEWFQFKCYYTATSTGSKAFEMLIDSKGTFYMDDFEIYEVVDYGDGYEAEGENLLAPSEGVIGGNFEFELIVSPNVLIDDDGNAAADAWIGNCFLMEDDAKLIVAVYDSTGTRLLSVNQKKWSECIPEDCEYKAFDGFMQVSAPYTEGNIVKAFVWDGNLSPLSEACGL